MNAPALELHRIDAAHNMRRFYRLDMQPDLFGGVFLVRQWGRIGARGHIVAERFDDEALAAAAFAQHAARKARRGYSVPAAGIADRSQIMLDTRESSINYSAMAAQANWC